MRKAFAIYLGFAGLALACPETAWAAGAGEDRWGIWLYVGRAFNLALVVGVLIWVGRKPLADFFQNRTRRIKEQLEEAQVARREAEAKLAEVEERMQRLESELEEIRAQAEKDAEEESRRILSETESDAERIIERARIEISGMTRTAQMDLKKHAAELSVRLAEENIRREITGEDRARLLSSFIANLGEKR